jgi:hypothetical protein
MEFEIGDFKNRVNPLLNTVLKNYEAMAMSTAVNKTYKQTVSHFLNRMTASDDPVNFRQAMRGAIRELSEQGISTIDYKSGRQSRMDSSVRNALMTEFTQVVQEVQRKLGEEIGTDGVEISAHEHCAVDHEPLQGHMFTNEEFKKLQNGDVAEDIEGEAFQIDRPIGKWNCHHMAFPVIIGVSEPSFSPEELDEIKERNEEGVDFHGEHYTLYEAEQEQRRIEHAMRIEKEKGSLYQQAMKADDSFRTDFRASRARSKELKAEYTELAEALKPKAIRSKPERATAPRDSRGNVPMVINGAMTQKQMAERAEMANRLARNAYPTETWIPAGSIPNLRHVTLPQNMDNIFIAESRIPTPRQKKKQIDLLKEINQIKALTDIGNTAYLTPEKGEYKKRAPDGTLNGWVAEMKSVIGNRNAIGHAFSDAMKKRDTRGRMVDAVYLEIANPDLSVNDVKNQIKPRIKTYEFNGRIIAAFPSRHRIYFWYAKDL